MKKEFIRNEDGRIRDCAQNIAKMNVFEYIFLFKWNHLHTWIKTFKEVGDSAMEFAKSFAVFLWCLFLIITLPIGIPLGAIYNIRHNRKVCVFWEKELKPKKEKEGD